MELTDLELRLITSGLWCLASRLEALGAGEEKTKPYRELADKLCHELDERDETRKKSIQSN
jgi:hypothetical protein